MSVVTMDGMFELHRTTFSVKSSLVILKIHEFVPDVIDASHRVDVGGRVEGAGDDS